MTNSTSHNGIDASYNNFTQWTIFSTKDSTTDSLEQLDSISGQRILEMRDQQAVSRNFSLFGNFLQIFTSGIMFILFVKYPKLRSVSATYALHVFVSIFGNGVAGLCQRLPPTLGDDFNYLTDTACCVIITHARVFYTNTLLFVAAVAMNRFFAICFPGKRFLSGKLSFFA